MAQWGDNAYTMPEAYPLNYLRRPLQILASTAWGSPRLAGYLDYEVLADRIGNPPGLPEVVDPAARPAGGTAFGPSGAASAFDDDPDTAFVASTAGAAAGLDLGADGAERLAGLRLLPRSNSSADLASLVGGTVQGCTDGPDVGCHTLATVQWTPTRDWLTLPVDDATRYRWVRFSGAPSARPALAELQILTSPTEVRLTVDAPRTLDPARANTVRVVVTNPTGHAVPQAQVRLEAHHLLDNTTPGALPGQRSVTIPPRQSRTVEFSIGPGAEVTPGTYRLVATADFRHTDDDPAARSRVRATTVTVVALHDLAQAFDNIAVTHDSNPQPGDVDGAQSSFSAEGLAAAGVGAGGSVDSDGLAFTLPTGFVGTEDNALAHGRLIPLTGHASRVGLLMTATYAPASGLTGTVTVTYTGGTSSALPITVPDWSATSVPKGTVIAADGGKVNGSGRAQSTRTAKLYTIAVDVDPARQLASITLPSGPQYMGSKTPALHVFAIARDRRTA
ncbi:hypothetical protein ACFVYE_13430 [Streptomyces sp. NPDC058239]|uniref:hypothetical protein n=1 Tax=Streptomyces sp. NPDC058239 TaxID=3346395 RepID=UPI0036E2B0EB